MNFRNDLRETSRRVVERLPKASQRYFVRDPELYVSVIKRFPFEFLNDFLKILPRILTEYQGNQLINPKELNTSR